MGFIRIYQTEAPELQIYAALSESQLFHYYEPEEGIFIAESPMIIQRALDAGYEPLSVLAEEKYAFPPEEKTDDNAGAAWNAVCGLLRKLEPAVPVYTAPLPVLMKITGFALTRGILCAMRRKPLPDPETLLSRALRVVVLERVMNPTNVGAIFRSAAALGMDAVLLSKGCADPLYRRAVRVSTGTVFQIPWTFVDSWPEDIAALQTAGFRTAAMALEEDSVSLQDFHPAPEDKIALIMGTEGYGLSPETIKACDMTVQIPMAHGVDSLNVAAASAVAFWHIRT